EEIDRRLPVTEDRRESSVGGFAFGDFECSGETWSGGDPEDCTEVDLSQDVVLDQDSSERGVSGQNFGPDLIVDVREVEAHDAELNGPAVVGSAEQDFAGVDGPVEFLVEDVDVDTAAVPGFHRHGHMLVV